MIEIKISLPFPPLSNGKKLNKNKAVSYYFQLNLLQTVLEDPVSIEVDISNFANIQYIWTQGMGKKCNFPVATIVSHQGNRPNMHMLSLRWSRSDVG